MTHTITHVPAPPTERPTPPGRSRSVIVGWLLVASGVVAAGVLLLVVTSPGPSPQPAPTQTLNGSLVDVPRYPEISDRWLAHHAEVLGIGKPGTDPQLGRYVGWPAGVPGSADAAERWFAQRQAPAGWPEGISRSADAAERWFAQRQAPAAWPEGINRSADAAERWFAQHR